MLDHIIIGENRFFSFADQGLIEEFEMDFMNPRLKGAPKVTRKSYKAGNKPGEKEQLK